MRKDVRIILKQPHKRLGLAKTLAAIFEFVWNVLSRF